MAVLPRPHPSSQPLEVRRELSSVLLDRDAVDPHRGITPQGSIRTFERWLVDEVSQREMRCSGCRFALAATFTSPGDTVHDVFASLMVPS